MLVRSGIFSLIMVLSCNAEAKQVLTCIKENIVIMKEDVFASMTFNKKSSWRAEATGQPVKQHEFYAINGSVEAREEGFLYSFFVDEIQVNEFVSNERISQERKVTLINDVHEVTCFVEYSSDNNVSF